MEETERSNGIATPLEDPTPIPLPESSVQRYKNFFKDFPQYPDEAIVTADSPSILGEQSIHFRESDIQGEIDWAIQEYGDGSLEFQAFLGKLADYIADQYPGNPSKWEADFVKKGIDSHTTLDAVKETEVASCFHRNLIYSYVL